MPGRVVTVHDYLLRKDPAKYKKLLGERVAAERREKKKALSAKQREELESKIEELETKLQAVAEADELADEREAELQAVIEEKDSEISTLKTEIEVLTKEKDKK